MSGYILCRIKRAQHPYFVENISTNIYSIEELCYYLHNNLYLIDQTIVNEELCDWIENELELKKLADKLRNAIDKFSGIEDVVYPIIKEINYLSYEELKELNIKLAAMDKEDPLLGQKQKADALVENKMYVHAIEIYQDILKNQDLETIREGLTENIYHNLGCAYSYMFQMRKATECFKNAYELNKSQKALETYLIAFGTTRNADEYEKLTLSLGVDEQTANNIRSRLKEFADSMSPLAEDENIDNTLSRLTREYHRSTGS